ncbi:MAG: aminotransferase class I/II-fold pyridoxal phosphate-dependent enzyme [Cyclobacteriaceae bacterium]
MMISFAKRIEQVEEYYFSKKLQEVRSLDSREVPIINLGIGSPDLPPSDEAVSALSDTATLPSSHGYQSYKGIPAFRQAISSFCKRTYSIDLDPDTMILPLMGSKEGIMHISMAFVNEGETVLIPDPGYPTYASVSKLVGASIETYQLSERDNWSIDFDKLEEKDLSKVKIMWINSPHMPTGSVLKVEDLQRLIDLAVRYNFLIVNDNPYSLILNGNPTSILSIEGAGEVAIELNSLSKSHNMAGWRVGWLAGKPEFLEAVLRVKSNMDSGMFLGIQQAAVQALAQGEKWFTNLNNIYRSRQVKAFQILDLLDCSYQKEQVGLFVWGKVNDSIENVEEWIDHMLYEAKVFITPGFIFGEAGSRYIRISLCATEENLSRAFDRLEKLSLLVADSSNLTKEK